jgi:type IV pilus assembly protein PilC
MIVEYEAVDTAGKRVADTIEANDLGAAVDALRRKDLFVTNARPTSEHSQPKRIADPTDDKRNVRLSAKQLTMFTRQMAMLLTSGSGVVSALQSVSRQFQKPAQTSMVDSICHDLEEGSPLTDALRKYPRTFDSSYCAIIAAGEASGTLTEMFSRLALVVGKRRTMRNKLVGATIYPGLLTCLSFGITSVMTFFVLPRFSDLFETLGADLPASTQFLIDTSEGLATNWIACTVVALVTVLSAAYFITSNKGRAILMELLLSLPVVKLLIHGLIQGETFRVLGMLTEARVGVLDAIALVKGVTNNARYQTLYDRMELEVTSGGSISKALESANLVPPYICHAIRTGEESGNLGSAMSYVADVLDEDNEELLNTVSKLFEPIILIGMGLVVGTIAVSLFLPMFDVTSAI